MFDMKRNRSNSLSYIFQTSTRPQLSRIHGAQAVNDGNKGGGEGDPGQVFRTEDTQEAAERQGSEDCGQGATHETEDEEFG